MSETVKGLSKLIKTLERIPKELDGDVERLVEANAREIEADAKIIVPVDLGVLKGSIKASKVKDKTWRIKANANGNAPYANYIEFGEPVGTGPHGGPKPYLYPSFFKGRNRFIDDLEQLLKSIFK